MNEINFWLPCLLKQYFSRSKNLLSYVTNTINDLSYAKIGKFALTLCIEEYISPKWYRRVGCMWVSRLGFTNTKLH